MGSWLLEACGGGGGARRLPQSSAVMAYAWQVSALAPTVDEADAGSGALPADGVVRAILRGIILFLSLGTFWLFQRILLFTYKALNGLSPKDLTDLLVQ